MIINSLKLKNIRSYIDEEMKFPEGSMMLSGDIGTGKSSILLAIEFALFGIIRGQLSGSALLRHGKREGFVELTFTLEKKQVTIRRNLKRSAKSITQDSGYIILDGTKQDLTPVELKSKILELIGYPDELLTKSKSFIYRYTVYTPQEEMKKILFESKDDRLNVLRRIFDIDKYKRIKENTLSYLKELKQKKTELETRIEDLEEKKIVQKEYYDKIHLIKEESEKIQKIIVEINNELKLKEQSVKELEDKIRQVEILKNQIGLKSNDYNNKKTNLANNEEELKTHDKEIGTLSEELKGFDREDVETLKQKKEEFQIKKDKLQENLEKIRDRESSFITMKKNSEDIINKIVSLEECPVCEQNVDVTHKDSVKAREQKNISDLDSQLTKLSDLKVQRNEEIQLLDKELEILTNKLGKQEIMTLKQARLDADKKKKEALLKEQIVTKAELEKLDKEILESKKKLEASTDIQTKYSEARKLYEVVREKQKVEEIKNAELVREEKTLREIQDRVKEEILKKEESKKKLAFVNEMQNWLLKYFMNIIYLMEKQIMLQIHQEFNQYFQEWFNILIEDENLNVRLDETFTPIIEQNGYESYMDNLSGGEKTSVALAYRLALNKVINDFIGTIKTKDILILDEPTDGFSSEQLDKIRELLEAIRIKQIILVSHEPKLESYVDHIVRVHKEEHVSKIIG
ncbi:SMC family ATPase [archaeon]|nr:SMC family ATPase [archaeon]